MSLDQGSDGWSACMFLLFQLRALLIVVPDTAHRLWNDVKIAMGRSKMMQSIHLGQVVFSFEHGPWTDKRWRQTAREGAAL